MGESIDVSSPQKNSKSSLSLPQCATYVPNIDILSIHSNFCVLLQGGPINRGGLEPLVKKKRQKYANLWRSAVLVPGTQGAMGLGGPPAFLSSSSLSEPPEELLSEATSGAFLPASEHTSAGTKEHKLLA